MPRELIVRESFTTSNNAVVVMAELKELLSE